MQRLFYLFVLSLLGLGLTAQTIIERHGQLTVDGNRIRDECGRVAQLKGMSYFWSQWEGKEYYNADVVKWLRDDWRVEVVRAALAVRGEDDYITNPATHYNRVTAVIDGAVEHGIYAIADFHAHDADQYLSQAKTFFRQISQRYGNTPNIIYEIWNEPIGGGDDASSRATWARIKTYAREVIAVIRANDPDGLIVVGTPFYSQRVDIATEDPLTTDINGNPVGNVAYVIHAYVGTHRQSLRDKGNVALNRGYALFMTECGRTAASADGPVYPAEWDRWENWMDANGISYAKWSLSNKTETSSSMQPGAPARGGWTNAQLRPEGQWNRNHFRAVNASKPSVCGGTGGTDDIISTSTPSSVRRGQTVTVGVNYSASTNRDIQVVFQQDAGSYTTYVSKKVDVSAGSGTRNVNITIPNNVPVANDAYQFQVFLTTNGGNWNNRLDNLAKGNVDVTAATTTTNRNIYTDNLNNSWANWSWGGSATVRDGGIKQAGSYSFKYDFNNGGAVSFRHPNGFSSDNLVRLEFWARTWSGSTTFQVSGSYDDNYGNAGPATGATVNATWKKFSITNAQLGNFGWYKRFFIYNGGTGATIFLDNVRLVYQSGSALGGQTETVATAGADELMAPTTEVFPNPSEGTATLRVNLPLPPAGPLTIEVTDAAGRTVVTRSQEVHKGVNVIPLNLGERAVPGLYLIRVSDGAGGLRLTERWLVR